MKKFKISKNAETALELLEKNGYEAWLAGGCVRDLVMGSTPHDWDITTSAKPQEIISVFSKSVYKTIETGIEHGTVTVFVGGERLEITTFRSEGKYTDHRRPDSVCYVTSIEEDVMRRDFTMNGLVYNPANGVLDLVGGLEDIENKTIRAIGNPFERFNEDGLRIMRALRFSSALGFEIEKKTEEALIESRGILREISEERKREEFTRLLTGKDVKYVLFRYSSVIEIIIPNIHPMIGFEQNNPHHSFDVWVHTLEAVQAVRPDPVLRLTMFFHDIEKPSCHTMDSDGISHFFTHPEKSAKTAEQIMKNLKYSGDMISKTTGLIRVHDYRFPPDRISVLRLLNRIGEDNFRLLLEVKRADIAAQSPYFKAEKEDYINRVEAVFNQIIEEGACFSLRNLAINGDDLICSGYKPGREVGKLLQEALNAVIDEKIKNEKTEIFEYLKIYPFENGVN